MIWQLLMLCILVIWSKNQVSSQCVDQSNEFLEEHFMSFYRRYARYHLRNLDNLIKYNRVGNMFNDVQASYCDFRLLDRRRLSQLSVCPWRNVAVFREDTFPRFFLEARCECTNCDNSPDDLYECRPFNQTVPVLKRSNKCLLNGLFKYEPDEIQIPVACICVSQTLKNTQL